MPEMNCQITIVLPTRATEPMRDDIEEALLDGFDENLGDVDEAYFENGRHLIRLSVRDLKSGVIGIRRVVKAMKGIPAGILLNLEDDEGEQRTLPFEGDGL